MGVDWQLVAVTLAAGAATVFAVRRTLLQFQRLDDEPGGCHGCPANPVERARIQRRKGAAWGRPKDAMVDGAAGSRMTGE